MNIIFKTKLVGSVVNFKNVRLSFFAFRGVLPLHPQGCQPPKAQRGTFFLWSSALGNLLVVPVMSYASDVVDWL